MDFAENWVTRLRQHKFSEYLYPKQELILRINIEAQSFHLSFSRERVEKLKSYSGKEDAIITGSTENLRKVFDGSSKLQEAVQCGQIEIKSSFRTLLLLESIFWFSPQEK